MSDELDQPRLGKHGGPRTKGQRSAHIMPSGGRRDYIIARLERDNRHDLAEAIRDGRVSALSIAVQLGWTKRPAPLGTGSSNAMRRRQHQLKALAGGTTLDQLQELWLGPNPSRGGLFSSRQELQAAWEQNRDEVMRLWGGHGRRPAAFYEFEWDGPHPAYDVERSTLWRVGLLTEAERTELEHSWRSAFDARGKDGRTWREHYEHHDIPQELVEAWTAERRRRGRQQLAASPEETEVAE